MDPTTLTGQLGTITAIVALALGIVQVLKLLLIKYRVGIVSSLPTPLLCVGVSMALAVIANIGGYLPGMWYDVLWQATLASGAASGFFTWVKEPLDSPSAKSARCLLPFLVPLVLLGGCTGMSDGQKYKIASNTYSTTLNVLSDLRDAGYLTTADRQTVTALRLTAGALLDQMEQDVIDKKDVDFQYMMSTLNTILDELLRMQIQAERVKRETQAGKQVSYDGTGSGFDSQGSNRWSDPDRGHNRNDPEGEAGLDTARGRDGPHAAEGGGGPLGRWRTGEPIPPITVTIPLSALTEVEYD